MILVIGGTGKTGRRIVQRLEDKGFAVRIGSRPVFDWDDPSTWAPALDGIDAAYVAFYPDLAVPGAPEAIERLAGLAKAAGVRKLVLLSGRGEDEALASEKIVQDSGLRGPWCGPAGSARTSARVICWSRSCPARWCCLWGR